MWSNCLDLRNYFIRQTIGVCIQQMKGTLVFDPLVRPLHDQLERVNAFFGSIRSKRCNNRWGFAPRLNDKGLP